MKSPDKRQPRAIGDIQVQVARKGGSSISATSHSFTGDADADEWFLVDLVTDYLLDPQVDFVRVLGEATLRDLLRNIAEDVPPIEVRCPGVTRKCAVRFYSLPEGKAGMAFYEEGAPVPLLYIRPRNAPGGGGGGLYVI